MRTAPTRRSTSSPRPQLLRRLLRLLAMVFGEGSAAARARWSSSVAAELRRPALRPLRLPPPVPFHGGAGQIRRPRARPVAAAAISGGLDVRLRRWRRPPRAPGRPDLARPPPPFLADGHDGARARPWQGADPRQAARWSGGGGSSRCGGGAGAGAAGEARVDVLEGLSVDFPLVQRLFCKKNIGFARCAQSNGREKWVTWPR